MKHLNRSSQLAKTLLRNGLMKTGSTDIGGYSNSRKAVKKQIKPLINTLKEFLDKSSTKLAVEVSGYPIHKSKEAIEILEANSLVVKVEKDDSTIDILAKCASKKGTRENFVFKIAINIMSHLEN